MNDNRVQIEELRKDFLISEIEKYEKEYINISKSESICKDDYLNLIYNYLCSLREESHYLNQVICGVEFNKIFESNNLENLTTVLEEKYNNTKLYEAYSPKSDKPKKVKGKPKKARNIPNIQDNLDKH